MLFDKAKPDAEISCLQLGLGANTDHDCIIKWKVGEEPRANCSCGATWVYPVEVTQQRMISIYESHLRYFNKPKMETL